MKQFFFFLEFCCRFLGPISVLFELLPSQTTTKLRKTCFIVFFARNIFCCNFVLSGGGGSTTVAQQTASSDYIINYIRIIPGNQCPVM